jgi:hypothetical protein
MMQVQDILTDAGQVTFWAKAVGPIIGSVTLTQVWKLWYRDNQGKKPRGYTTAFVSATICMLLSSLVYWLFGDPIKLAVGYGVMIGPASPILWAIAQAFLPQKARDAMRGNRRRQPREDDRQWTEQERADYQDQTMFGDTGINQATNFKE